MPPADFTDPALLDELTLLVSQAAGAIMRARADGPSVRMKSDSSPVTGADEAAEAIILDGLARILPGLAVISEEATSRSAPPQPPETFALVDPLDGTREFVAGRNEFTVNIALIHAGRPVSGIVGAPALDLIWRGVTSAGAERLRLASGAALKSISEKTPIRTALHRDAPLRAMVSRSHLDPATETWLKRLPAAERMDCGSSIKFCRIAEGLADVYPRLGPTSEWDIAAGDAVLTAAGGAVLRLAGGPVLYGQDSRSLIVPAFVAWGDLAAATRFDP